MSGAFAYASACKDETEIGLIKVYTCTYSSVFASSSVIFSCLVCVYDVAVCCRKLVW